MGVFGKNANPKVSIKRNTFDLSFKNNLTLNFGNLYPVLCKPVIPGDSMRIDTAFGLRFMPFSFPIQTKIRADLHFFYVRNRNLWDDWQEFITQSPKGKTSVLPYLTGDNLRSMARTGLLADYLGLPTTVIGGVDNVNQTYVQVADVNVRRRYTAANFGVDGFFCDVNNEVGINVEPQFAPGSSPTPIYSFATRNLNISSGDFPQYLSKGMQIRCTLSFYFDGEDNVETLWQPDTVNVLKLYLVNSQGYTSSSFSVAHLSISSDFKKLYCDFTYIDDEPKPLYPDTFKNYRLFGFCGDYTYSKNSITGIRGAGTDLTSLVDPGKQFEGWKQNVICSSFDFQNETVLESGDVMPYPVNVNALPFRAYESIYNSFYRDSRNNPYKVNGVVEYNKYIPTTEGGEDKNTYVLRRRNWEQDFITSAVPSPQQGVAPLVGLTSTGVATFQDGDKSYDVPLVTGDDADTVVNANIPEDAPQSVRNAAVYAVTQGISISDFRAVNSLQRWLETNIRRGMKYRDQIYSHFGVDTDYKTLDMPEFIGGCSQVIDMNTVVQTSDGGDDAPLGSYAGYASCMGSSKHAINKYFDEHGYVIAILSVVPVPSYSQLMPKDFLKTDCLDYYFPEFGHLGFQPITYKEVCPLQTKLQGDSLEDVFGYQRAWYDYLASVDEVHGNFRTDLRDYLFGRVFLHQPTLNSDFFEVNSDQMNNPFSVQEGSDSILGQVAFSIKAKRPIPRYGIARLE